MRMYHNHYQHHHSEHDKILTSLDCVISAMCAPKLFIRASLMYLLDVISEYCRCHQQIKPFSHIVMDLFQEVMEKSKMHCNATQLKMNKNATTLDNRSDTDPGHSSTQGDRDKVSDGNKLRVSRTTADEDKISVPFNKFNPIGFSAQFEMEEKPLEPSKRLQVTRRRDEILKKRNRSRRNTIAVNLLDIEKLDKCRSNVSWDGSSSKSTNCIDKIGRIEENGFAMKISNIELNGSSMPELNDKKFSTLPNLKVRRAKETSNSNETINYLVTIKSKGPEFIANSSLSPRMVDITDIKILAVNGKFLLSLSYDQSLKILQNTGITVELTVSQIFKQNVPPKQVSNIHEKHHTKNNAVRNITRSMKNSFKFKKDRKSIENKKNNGSNVRKIKGDNEKPVGTCDIADWNCKNGNEKSKFKVQSMPDLPKFVGAIPKHQVNDKGTLPRTMGLSRKYVGPVRYPVTPIRPTSSLEKKRLSLLADNMDKQVFI